MCAMPAVWFPTIKTNTGTDHFTINLVEELTKRGIRAEISWLPHYAEYLPWLIRNPGPPEWANIIHINSWLHPRFYKYDKLPVVVSSHGCVHDSKLHPYKSISQKFYHKLWIKRLEKKAFECCSASTAVSYYTAKLVAQNFGDAGIHVIPNWLTNEAFKQPIKRQQHQPFRLLYLGRFNKRKGVDLLPKIMQGLDETYELNYTKHPKDKEIFTAQHANVSALGWTTDSKEVQEWIDQADALIFPSRMEGMPLAVLEAMARGLPIICSDSSSLPEIVTNNINGLICPANDINAFINAIRGLKQDPTKWKLMRESAFSYSVRKHNVDIIKEYIKIYTYTNSN